MIRDGDCVRLNDGRVGRVRGRLGGSFKIRVRRKTSETHQFLMVPAAELQRIPCPAGWMSPEGYRRYLKVTLAKMRQRRAAERKK